MHQVGELVEQVHIVGGACDLAFSDFPAMERFGLGFVEVAARPCEAIAHGFQRNAHSFQGAQFTKIGILVLEELHAANPHVATPGTQQHTKRGGRFALAVAGVDNHQPFLSSCRPAPRASSRCARQQVLVALNQLSYQSFSLRV